MNIIEKQFRDTPSEHKKHLLRTINYIKYLLDNKRVIEARFYLNKIHQDKKCKLNIIYLGYELAVRCFDKKSLIEYDTLLYKHRKSDSELSYYRLMYYFSQNDVKNCEMESRNLLSHNVDLDKIRFVIEVFINTKSPHIAKYILNHIKHKKISLSIAVTKEMRRILLTHLMNTIIKSKYE